MPTRIISKPFLFGLGCVSLALGLIGAFLPILPTTPFVILAAFLFSKSSSRMHAWVLSLPQIGPAVQQWEQYKVIEPRAKKLATISIIVVFGITLFFTPVKLFVKVVLVIIAICVLIFIWSRPSFPQEKIDP